MLYTNSSIVSKTIGIKYPNLVKEIMLKAFGIQIDYIYKIKDYNHRIIVSKLTNHARVHLYIPTILKFLLIVFFYIEFDNSLHLQNFIYCYL